MSRVYSTFAENYACMIALIILNNNIGIVFKITL